MCDEAIHIDPYLLEFVHHHFKTQKTCAEAEPYLLKFILDCSRSSKCLSKHYTKQYLLKSVLKEEILKYWKRTSDGRICFWQVQNTKSLVSKKPRNVFRSSRQKPYLLKPVSDHYIAQKITNETMRITPIKTFFVPDCFKTEGMCIRAVEADPWQLHVIPNRFENPTDVWWCSMWWLLLSVICP